MTDASVGRQDVHDGDDELDHEKNYYEHHKNTISIENEKIEVSIRLFEKPETILQEVKYKENEKISA